MKWRALQNKLDYLPKSFLPTCLFICTIIGYYSV